MLSNRKRLCDKASLKYEIIRLLFVQKTFSSRSRSLGIDLSKTMVFFERLPQTVHVDQYALSWDFHFSRRVRSLPSKMLQLFTVSDQRHNDLA